MEPTESSASSGGCLKSMVSLAPFLPVGLLAVWLIPDRPNPARQGIPARLPSLPRAAANIRVGDDVILGLSELNGAWLAVDAESHGQWNAAVRSNDPAGPRRLREEGKVFPVPAGTRARVLQAGERAYRVRCQDGAEGWVSEWLVGPTR